MKKLLLFSVLIAAFLGFAAVALAQEASVFGNNVLVRAFLVQTPDSNPAMYSAYLEVRDDEGVVLSTSDFAVEGVLGTHTPTVDENPFQIHFDDIVTPDISISYDNLTKTIYVFCTNEDPGLHVMKYDIHLNTPATPIDGVCGSSNGGTFTSAPSTNLCSVGNATTVTGSGPWDWTCLGTDGGSTATCSANIQAVNGVCGSSNGGTFTSAPTTNLCSAGNATTVTGSGPWNWTCTGTNGGSTAPCSANIQSSNPADLAFRTSYGYVLGITGPKAGYNNVPFYETVTINNYGTGNAGSFTVKMWLTSTAYTSQISTHCNLGADAELLYTWNVSGLAAGQSRTQEFSPLLVTGKSIHTTYYICTEIDTGGQVSENNKANNAYTFTFGFYR